MGWSAAALSAWGKTDSATSLSLPAVKHLEDTAAVAGFLWDAWLPAAVTQHIGRALPEGLVDGRRLLVFLAGIHDIGKIAPSFAGKLRGRGDFLDVLDRMATAGLRCPKPRTGHPPPPHCRVGHLLTADWLVRTYGGSRRHARQLAGVVGAHHGTPPTSQELKLLRGAEHEIGERAWRAVQDEVLLGMAVTAGADTRLPDWLGADLPISVQMLLAATVVVADWLASDSARFPYGDPRSAMERCATAISDWDLPPPWSAAAAASSLPTDELLAARFPRLRGRPLRPIQAAAVEAAHRADRAPLVIIEAGTGDGKTEAALLAAEVLASRFGQGGVMFALPTQATSDGLFPRLRDWVESIPGVGRTSMFLAHGKATLNDDYRGLVRAGFVTGVEDECCGLAAHHSRAVVTSWLRGRRKGVLADFVVGTIDQVLFMALKSRHVALRHLAMAGKVVVLDEVHAADDYMRIYLCRALEWLATYGTPVIVLSATLPPSVRHELVAAWRQGTASVVGQLGGESAQDSYPRITTVDSTVRVTCPPGPGAGERLVAVSLEPDESRSWVGEVCSAVRAGACVAVIRNTVRRAQDDFRALRDELGADRVTLLHSRFLSVDRVTKEARLRAALGPPDDAAGAPSRPTGFLVVGTQVLEQSLDIDVDLMVSDVAPIDLILQRAGRLHRHLRGKGQLHRPLCVRAARLILLGAAIAPGKEPHVSDAAARVYCRAALLRALAVLAPYVRGEPLQLPRDIVTLVRRGYAADLPPPPGWEDGWLTAETEAHAQARDKRERAAVFLCDPPAARVDLVGFASGRASEPDDDSPRSRAQVRDTEDALEVIVVRRIGAALRPMPGLGSPLADTDLPTDLAPPAESIARALAACTVRLPAWMTRGTRFDIVVTELERASKVLEGWQQSHWLKGELVLILDQRSTATLGGTQLTYDSDLGLVVEPPASAAAGTAGRVP